MALRCCNSSWAADAAQSADASEDEITAAAGPTVSHRLASIIAGLEASRLEMRGSNQLRI